MTLYRRLVWTATALAVFVIMLGAFVRLMDAGLGCPDWPGCYGKLTPSQAKADIHAAVIEQGGTHGPVSMAKAWKEMVHRYLASFLGLLILGIAALAVRHRKALGQTPRVALILVGVVCLQGAFGAWTVTLLLKPAIVTGHLIGGLSVLALLTWLALRLRPSASLTVAQRALHNPQQAAALRLPSLATLRRLRMLAALGFVLVGLQIVLGGWVSTNYAGLACRDLPTCQGQWMPDMHFADAFHVVRELGQTASGDNLSLPALTAIHWTHRVGAVIVFGYCLALGVMLMRTGMLRRLGIALHAAVTAQALIGISNVVWALPLALAVLHNGGAALLVMVMVAIQLRLAQARQILMSADAAGIQNQNVRRYTHEQRPAHLAPGSI